MTNLLRHQYEVRSFTQGTCRVPEPVASTVNTRIDVFQDEPDWVNLAEKCAPFVFEGEASYGVVVETTRSVLERGISDVVQQGVHKLSDFFSVNVNDETITTRCRYKIHYEERPGSENVLVLVIVPLFEFESFTKRVEDLPEELGGQEGEPSGEEYDSEMERFTTDIGVFLRNIERVRQLLRKFTHLQESTGINLASFSFKDEETNIGKFIDKLTTFLRRNGLDISTEGSQLTLFYDKTYAIKRTVFNEILCDVGTSCFIDSSPANHPTTVSYVVKSAAIVSALALNEDIDLFQFLKDFTYPELMPDFVTDIQNGISNITEAYRDISGQVNRVRSSVTSLRSKIEEDARIANRLIGRRISVTAERQNDFVEDALKVSIVDAARNASNIDQVYETALNRMDFMEFMQFVVECYIPDINLMGLSWPTEIHWRWPTLTLPEFPDFNIPDFLDIGTLAWPIFRQLVIDIVIKMFGDIVGSLNLSVCGVVLLGGGVGGLEQQVNGTSPNLLDAINDVYHDGVSAESLGLDKYKDLYDDIQVRGEEYKRELNKLIDDVSMLLQMEELRALVEGRPNEDTLAVVTKVVTSTNEYPALAPVFSDATRLKGAFRTLGSKLDKRLIKAMKLPGGRPATDICSDETYETSLRRILLTNNGVPSEQIEEQLVAARSRRAARASTAFKALADGMTSMQTQMNASLKNALPSVPATILYSYEQTIHTMFESFRKFYHADLQEYENYISTIGGSPELTPLRQIYTIYDGVESDNSGIAGGLLFAETAIIAWNNNFDEPESTTVKEELFSFLRYTVFRRFLDSVSMAVKNHVKTSSYFLPEALPLDLDFRKMANIASFEQSAKDRLKALNDTNQLSLDCEGNNLEAVLGQELAKLLIVTIFQIHLTLTFPAYGAVNYRLYSSQRVFKDRVLADVRAIFEKYQPMGRLDSYLSKMPELAEAVDRLSSLYDLLKPAIESDFSLVTSNLNDEVNQANEFLRGLGDLRDPFRVSTAGFMGWQYSSTPYDISSPLYLEKYIRHNGNVYGVNEFIEGGVLSNDSTKYGIRLVMIPTASAPYIDVIRTNNGGYDESHPCSQAVKERAFTYNSVILSPIAYHQKNAGVGETVVYDEAKEEEMLTALSTDRDFLAFMQGINLSLIIYRAIEAVELATREANNQSALLTEEPELIGNYLKTIAMGSNYRWQE